MNSEDRHKLFKNEDYFVENVRNFDQLLDQLVPNLLPQEIKGHLLKVDGDPKAQKKELLNTIPKRGPKAFSFFMNCLRATGNEDVANTIQLGNPETGQIVKKATYRRDHDNNTCYRMRSNPRGLALIINMMQFRDNAHEPRFGSEKDVRDLEKLFTELNFKVTVFSDLTYTGINREVYRFSQLKEHEEYDCCVVIVMSHGKSASTKKRGVDIFCHDNVVVHSQDLVQMFYAGCCPALARKPKLFFFQACRGKMKEYGVDVDTLISNMSNMNVQDGCDCGEIPAEFRPQSEHTAGFDDSTEFNRSQSVPTARLDDSSEFVRTQSAPVAGFDDTTISSEVFLSESDVSPNLTTFGHTNVTITSNEITRDSNDPCFADISFNSAINGFSDSSNFNGYNDSNGNLMNSPHFDNFHLNGNSDVHNNYFRDFDLDDSNTVTDAVMNEEGNSPTTPSNTPLANVTPPVSANPVLDINPFRLIRGSAGSSNEELRNNNPRGIKFVQGNGTDIFITYSTQPGYVSLRSEASGAWVMQEVCNVFAEHAHKDDLNTLLNKVMDNLDKFYQGSSKGIALLHLENLHFKKKLFFNPGL